MIKAYRYLRNLHNTIKSFKNNHMYLLPGDYWYAPSKQCFYLDEQKSVKFTEGVLIRQKPDNSTNKLKQLIKDIITPRKVKIKKTKQKRRFSGTIYLPANDISIDREVKIFDLINNKILTKYSDVDKLHKKVEDYNCFGEYFNIPEIVFYDYKEGTSIERLIQSKSYKTWDKDDLEIVNENLKKAYLSYFSIVSKKKVEKITIEDLTERLIYNPTLFVVAKEIASHISNSVIADLPLAKQHGDLWYKNVLLYKNNSIYVIDWEHSGDYSILYDLFWFIQNAKNYYPTDYFINLYFDGHYDSFLETSFALYGYEYSNNNKVDYFYFFVLEALYQRTKDKDEKLTDIIVNYLYNLFIEIKNKYRTD